MIDLIDDDVFLSGAGPVLSEQGRKEIKELQITHILTISAMAVPIEKRIPGITYKFIFAMDLGQQDILSKLDEGVEFITDAVKSGGRVLVHCEAGMSRSVSFVAAYLMKKNKWTAEKAVFFIRNVRPSAQPNKGFMDQLETYHALTYSADSMSLNSSQDYRLFRHKAGIKPTHKDIPTTTTEESSSDAPSTSDTSCHEGVKYRCSKCRQTLFYHNHLMKHNRSDGEPCTFGYLIEPMKWMVVDSYEGKINCPKCNDKLGYYSWGGRQCQGDYGVKCREQVQPWVHMHKNKVDEVSNKNISQLGFGVIPSVVIS